MPPSNDGQREQAWRRAQACEREFWAPMLTPERVAHINEHGDTVNDEAHLNVVAPWVRRAFDVGVDLGCGPCGLLPFLDVRYRVAIDPLVTWFESKGIDYGKLGYVGAIAGRMEDAPALLLRADIKPWAVNIVCCCNVLDHVADLEPVIDALCGLGHPQTQAILIYDLRHTATPMHPTMVTDAVVSAGMRKQGWTLADSTLKAPTHDRQNITGRSYELWSKL